MENKYYNEYRIVPARDDVIGSMFWSSLMLLSTLEKLEMTTVFPSFRAHAHDWVIIQVDGRSYDEGMLRWIRRFQ